MDDRQLWSWDNLNEDEAHTLAKQFSHLLNSGDIVALRGSLGMGKTSFARALIRGYTDNETEEVPSPTFTLVQTYPGKDITSPKIWHFDLYRLSTPEEALELDIDDAFNHHISLIEWPENLGEYLPHNCLILTIKQAEVKETRSYHFNGGNNWKDRLNTLQGQMKS